jgi:glycosyltransferase involved in cell wall biosynthesis
MKLALLTNDNRDTHREYHKDMPWFGTAPEALLQGFANLPGLEVHVVSCTQRPMKSPAKLAGNIYFHSLLVPKLGWMRTLYQGCIRATRRKLREIDPDLVHGQGTERDCSISGVLSGFPCVMTIHGNMRAIARLAQSPPLSFRWLAARLEDWTLPRSLGVFCNSAHTEMLVRPRNPRTWRVPNALREDFFAETAERSADGPLRLINVGTINANKRQREILAVCRNLHAKGHRFHMKFLGLANAKDPYAATFLREMARPGVGDYASFCGFLEQRALIETFDQMDACVHFPSEEAFGLVVAEALARNLKFFGSRVGGLIDIADSVESAELFAANDWNGLENAVARWMKSGAPRSISAAKVMRERYHPDVIARRHMEIYQEVLAAEPSARSKTLSC